MCLFSALNKDLCHGVVVENLWKLGFADCFSSLNLSDVAARSLRLQLSILRSRHNTLSIAPSMCWCSTLTSDQFIASAGICVRAVPRFWIWNLKKREKYLIFVSQSIDLILNDVCLASARNVLWEVWYLNDCGDCCDEWVCLSSHTWSNGNLITQWFAVRVCSLDLHSLSFWYSLLLRVFVLQQTTKFMCYK